jgi:hypothetical protein
MKSLFNKKLRIGKYSIPLLPLLLIVISSALATMYVTLQFTITTPVQQYPKVTFWEWSTAQKKNAFGYSMNIFANIKTIDENITCSIFNDDSVQHQCYLRLSSIINPSNIAKISITIYNSTKTIFTEEWTEFQTQPTAWKTFVPAAHAKYTIWIEITGAGNPSGSSSFTAEIKEENP